MSGSKVSALKQTLMESFMKKMSPDMQDRAPGLKTPQKTQSGTSGGMSGPCREGRELMEKRDVLKSKQSLLERWLKPGRGSGETGPVPGTDGRQSGRYAGSKEKDRKRKGGAECDTSLLRDLDGREEGGGGVQKDKKNVTKKKNNNPERKESSVPWCPQGSRADQTKGEGSQ